MHFMNHNWSAEYSRYKLPFSFVRGHFSTMWDIVWVSPQGHRSVSVSHHFLLQAPQCPCSVQKKRFSTVAEEGQNPVDGFWGHTLGVSWQPEPTFSYASIDFRCQFVTSPATAASWMSMVGWGYQAGLVNCNVWHFSPSACQW